MLPTVLAKVTSPEPTDTSSAKAPLMAPPNETSLSVVVSVTASSSVIALAKLISSVAVISAAKLFVPAPDCVKPPVTSMSPLVPVLNRPALAIATSPPVIRAALMVSLFPVNPKAPSRVVIPPNFVSPVLAAALCVKLAASSVSVKVTSPADTSVTAPRGPVAPTAPSNNTSPAPAVIVSVRTEEAVSEFKVEPKVTSPSVVVSATLAAS